MRKSGGPRINNEIRVPEIRLIGDEGKQYGVVSIHQAKLIAQDTGLDLVEVSPNERPPVVKLMDYGKFKYKLQKKNSEAKKKQVTIQIKELKFRPNIELHDLNVKLKKIQEFLEEGDKIKMVMQFRGREMAHKDLGLAKFQNIINQAIELGAAIEAPPEMLGPRCIAMLMPGKKK